MYTVNHFIKITGIVFFDIKKIYLGVSSYMMDKKILIYTAIFGSGRGLIEQPKFKNVDYICFTNRTGFSSKSWKIIQVAEPIKNDPTRSNRYYKICPHLHVSSAYGISVYIDGNIRIFKDFTSLIEKKMNHYSMMCFDHNQLAIGNRNCIYEEYKAIVEIAHKYGDYKDCLKIMERQIYSFRKEEYPKNNGLITGSVLIRKHFDLTLIKVMECWWEIVKNQSKRDQLNFNYVAWKLNFKNFSYMDGDLRKGNPWFHVFKHNSVYGKKIWKLKLKRFFLGKL